mgnify:CR=1 FL=1
MNAEIYNTAEELVGLLKEKKLLIATAESCTGGLVSSCLLYTSDAADEL